jgi:hypothetical protein
MNNNTIFEAWQNTQHELMNNWTESSRRLQDTVNKGTVAEKGFTIYQEWLTKQTEITKKAAEQASHLFQQAASNPEMNNAASLFQQWLQAQQDTMNKAFAQFKNPFAGNFNWNNWAMPSNFWSMNPWTQNNQNWYQNFVNQSNDWMKNPMITGWMNQYEQMMRQFTDNLTKEAWSGMTDMNGMWMKFNEMWQPVYKSMIENMQSNEWMKQLYSTDAMKSLTDRMLIWLSPLQTKEVFQRWNSWMEMANNYNKHVWTNFAGTTPEQFQKLIPFLMLGNDNTMNLFAIYQRAVSPLVRLFNPGKEAEFNEIISGLMNKASVYGQKMVELQQHMYITSVRTMETYMQESFEQVKKGADLSNSKEVFQNWVNCNETAFINLFSSETYSNLQGELLDMSLDIRKHMDELMELTLQHTPVVLRSEADGMNQTIYELRKRVYQLEKQLNSAEPAPTKTPKKKTAATV